MDLPCESLVFSDEKGLFYGLFYGCFMFVLWLASWKRQGRPRPIPAAWQCCPEKYGETLEQVYIYVYAKNNIYLLTHIYKYMYNYMDIRGGHFVRPTAPGS